MRIITVEEHFEHPGVTARVGQLADPSSSVHTEPSYDRDSLARLGGNRLTHMDAAGIDIQVISHGNGSPGTLSSPEAVGLCRRVNDNLAAQIAEYPNRFRGFATIPLYDAAAAAEELRRCVGDLGFVGVLVAGSYDGLFLDDPRFDPILAAAESVDLPIYIHPGPPPKSVVGRYYKGQWPLPIQLMFSGPAFGWHADAGIHVLRLILSGALDRHPGLKLISGHWGELAAFTLNDSTESLAEVTAAWPECQAIIIGARCGSHRPGCSIAIN